MPRRRLVALAVTLLSGRWLTRADRSQARRRAHRTPDHTLRRAIVPACGPRDAGGHLRAACDNPRMRIFVALPVAAAALLVAAVLAPVASADSVPFADDGALPWVAGATVTSPLEGFAATVATRIAGRSVTVRCEGDNDWQKLAYEAKFDPNSVLGYVRRGSDFMELSPRVCLYMQKFAAATSKPTKCSASVTEQVTVYETRRVQIRQRFKVRVRVNGKLVSRWKYRTVWQTKQVPVTVERTVPGPPASCYVNGRAVVGGLGDAYWGEYHWYAQSMLTLAHESIHLSGRRDEAEATCYGIQWLPYVAEQFGATADDARAITTYAYNVIYPRYKALPGYWSPECRDGGALDLRPADTRWP